MTTTTTNPSVPSTKPTPATAIEGDQVPVKKPKRPSKKRTNPESGSSPSNQGTAKPSPKRRKPTANTTGATAANGTSAAATAPRVLPVPPPTNILIIDNGGDTVKYGWAASSTTTSSSPVSSSQQQPFLMTNITARLQHQWTVLVGDEWEEYSQQHAASSSAVLSRSFERGILVNLGHQVMVWKRILEVLGVTVVISNRNSETAQALGWKANTNTSNSGNNNNSSSSKKTSKPQTTSLVAASSCAALLLLPPFCPRVMLDQIFHVWLEDFGVSHVGFALSSTCAASIPPSVSPVTTTIDTSSTGCVCLVDLGWSAVHIVPTYQGRLIVSTSTANSTSKTATSCGIRRVPLGGRHLINLWKYTTTYRQWNLMDQEAILRQVHHRLAYVTLDFPSEIQMARQRPAGQRPFDREVVLPDFQTTFDCWIQIPRALQKRRQEEKEVQEQLALSLAHDKTRDGDEGNDNPKNGSNENVDKEQEDEVVARKGDQKNQKKDDVDDDEEEEDYDDDEEEETMEQKRKRLLRERQEEEERRRDQQQVLQVSVERFAIPEVLFRPSDAGLPESMAGVPQAIVQSIMACPSQYQAALFQSIHLVGGVAQLKNMTTRLQKEIRALAPVQYPVKVTVSSQPVTQAWKGAQAFVHQAPFDSWAWSKHDWLPHVTSKKASNAHAATSQVIVPPSATSHGLYAKLMSKNSGMFV